MQAITTIGLDIAKSVYLAETFLNALQDNRLDFKEGAIFGVREAAA